MSPRQKWVLASLALWLLPALCFWIALWQWEEIGISFPRALLK